MFILLVCVLLPDGTGIEIEDSVAERTPAQCLLDALRAYEDPLSLEDKVFSRPLSVTAPKVSTPKLNLSLALLRAKSQPLRHITLLLADRACRAASF